jgi:hypothetical protein
MNSEKQTTTTLCNGRRIDTAFLDLIHEVVQDRIKTIPYDVPYTLKQICGKDFWKQLEDSEVERAGFCMSHLVTTNAVDMEEVGKDVHNAKLYRRINRSDTVD